MEDLEDVLKQLKNEKSRDPMGFINELFKPMFAGTDLKRAVLRLMNTLSSYSQSLFNTAT